MKNNNKQEFIGFIKTLGMKPEVEKIVLGFVESHEFSQETVEKTAVLLEKMADTGDMAREELDKAIVEMEMFKGDVMDARNNYEELTDKAQEKFMTDATAFMDEETKNIKSEMPAGTGPVEPMAPAEAGATGAQPMVEAQSPEVVPQVEPIAPLNPVNEPLPLQPDLTAFSPAPQPTAEQPMYSVLPPLEPQTVVPPVVTPVQDNIGMEPRLPEQPSIMGDEPVATPVPQPPTF